MMDSAAGNESKQVVVTNKSIDTWKRRMGEKAKLFFLEKGWLLFIVGFLLGRAIVLSSLSPFALSFLASVWFLRKDKSFKLMMATVAGGLTLGWQHGVYVGVAMIAFIILASFFKHVEYQQKVIPMLVFGSSVLARVLHYLLFEQLTSYEWMLAGVEAVLSSVLVLIFMQSIPLLSPKRYKPTLKNEEIVCLIILIASVLTGMIGWQIQGASIEQIASRYLVLWLSYVGGAAIGSTVGVVAGLILSLANVASLYQMSLLAFSGLLGGLLKDGKKVGVGLGLLVGTMLIGIYGEGVQALLPSMIESAIAIIIFFCTPESWIRKISRYIPGTSEHSKEQEQYLQKVRDVTASRVEQFSNVFHALSKSFTLEQKNALEEESNKETDYFLSNVTEKTCQTCFKKEYCWAQQFDKTYDLMTNLKGELEDGQQPNKVLQNNFENHCVKSKKVLDTMRQELSHYEANQKLKKQVSESRRFVADQLLGVSEVMDNFAKEILKERENHEQQEVEIVAALKHMGIEIEKLDIYSLEKGNVDIEMNLSFYNYHGEGQKLIAPMLSDILKETVVVKEEEVSPIPNGYCYFSFGSAKKYVIETGVSHAARGGGFISGDSYSTIELGAGKYAMAISDGMGNGERAHEESTETLRLLQQILQSGIQEQVAIKSINSILSLRTSDEIFSTLDLAMIDLHNADVRFLKIGSTPSFIKRGNKIHKIEASNLPIGIIQEFDVEVVSDQLKAGDLLIMMSDGIFEGPKNVENVDMWLKRKIKEMETEDPQEVADLLLEEVVRTMSGEIEDDMTVLVAKIEKNNPKWAAIPTYHSEAN
ncbi:stage II sporulation protein E [Aquibacillus koreensis]|uniref:Stage II sporulation protein E n=1 Tax=Aquibacillus koreensis TaxID=279446 RepID=A0A9X3WS23_9BACI|nr:stage II sporulation protein E [Aquibacillus koreensis]MCT2534292.1 stage II sporulation protein E [Aquibacillus koreensis]MDC3422369.1 stage II sporulation protein E [Aquibacillus koreensis]